MADFSVDKYKIRIIEKILNEHEMIKSFDEGLFGVLVKEIRVISLVEVESVLKTGVVIREILR
ncbi:hypothetical protein [Caloranaerobacter sp. DY30410]|uniref:hypothetical protein n=1 Tax=Caloranaerobacter sp. DY30410 TaxID=3238305 RepID=UPI003D01E8AC